MRRELLFKLLHLQTVRGDLEIFSDQLFHAAVLAHLRENLGQLRRQAAFLENATPMPVVSSGSSRIRKSAP